jgi:error-prone DNA polymerase
VVMGARLVRIRGRLQSQSGVIHTVVEHIEDMTQMLGLLQQEAERFGGSARSDEALHLLEDHRRKPVAKGRAQSRPGEGLGKAIDHDEVAETARVMPKGRNFH